MKFCPGQDTQFWKSDDIFEVTCPHCKGTVEFFKDDVKQKCSCGKIVFNPKLDLGCALWCPAAAGCIGPEKLKSLKRDSRHNNK